jgi:hypothetical protein
MIPSNGRVLVFLLCATLCFLIASIIMYAITSQVNTRLSQGERFSYLGSYLTKNRKIAATYRQLFPRGRLLWLYRLCAAIGILFMVLTALYDR